MTTQSDSGSVRHERSDANVRRCDPLLRELRDQAINAAVAAGRDDLLIELIDDLADHVRAALDGCGCRAHAIRPGCVRHDPQGRSAHG